MAPFDRQAGFVYAVRLESIGQIKPALAELERIVKQRPYDVEVLSALVSFAEKAQRPDTATMYRKVLQQLEGR